MNCLTISSVDVCLCLSDLNSTLEYANFWQGSGLSKGIYLVVKNNKNVNVGFQKAYYLDATHSYFFSQCIHWLPTLYLFGMQYIFPKLPFSFLDASFMLLSIFLVFSLLFPCLLILSCFHSLSLLIPSTFFACCFPSLSLLASSLHFPSITHVQRVYRYSITKNPHFLKVKQFC